MSAHQASAPIARAGFCYRIYGLGVSCDLEIPELPQSGLSRDAYPDVRVRFEGEREIAEPSEWFNKSPLPTGEPFLACAKIDGGYLLRFEGMADFTVDRGGREIACVRVERDVSFLTLRHLLLDQVLPLVLNLLGHEALHATAVVIRGGVCAFIGPGGTGKSTLAASFLFAGYPVMGDDCLVLADRGGRIFATPAYPGLRLWRDAFDALSDGADRAIPVAGYTSKARLLGKRALANFPNEPLPLNRIYGLVRTDQTPDGRALAAPCATAMSAREAFVELFTAAFPFDVTDRAMLARQFRFFERVVEKVPVKRLLVPNDFSSLPAVHRAVLAELELK